MKESEGGKKIAFVDFDGTLILADSFKTALLATATPSFFFRVLKTIGKNASLVSNPNLSNLKEILTEAIFGGMRTDDFNALCNKISSRLSQYDNTLLIEELNNLKKIGFEIYIVTASPVNWVRPWGIEHGFNNIIGTEMEEVDATITGKFGSPNCKGDQKVARIKAAMDLSAYGEIVAYGNSKDDYPMLALAHKPFLVSAAGIRPWSLAARHDTL